MSAIAGIVYFGGAPVEPGLIEKLTGAMKARGPDEQTHWMQGSVALGHCMLRTTPESLEEHQPLTSKDKKLVLVWDGRLDNREELQRDLKAAGIIPRDASDAELALQSYEAWEEECPKHLLGDFAFALWDARNESLFCARDHIGARPFYYIHNYRYFAFASEDEALLNMPGVSHQSNEELIAYFLQQNFVDFDHARSWLADVMPLPSAHTLTIAQGRIARKNRYWRLVVCEEAKYTSDEDCQEAFLNVFGEAVRCRMRSIGHVSAMVSGGLDSASIAAMVRRLLPEMAGKEFHTYSAISDHPETCVESQCIQSLTTGLGDNAHLVSVPSFTGMLSLQDLIDTAWSKAHPVDNSILLPAMMCLAASRDGHRVMLHGMGGDLTMHVPNWYIAYWLKAGQWLHAWSECEAASRNNNYLIGVSPFKLMLRNIYFAFVPQTISRLVRRLRETAAQPPLANSMINPDFAKRLNLLERMRKRSQKTGWLLPGYQQELVRILLPPHGIGSGLTGYDRVAGRYGVEFRDPWSDKRVVEFWLRLPLKYKVRNGWTKYLVRTSFADELTLNVRWRLGKEHLGWNFASRLMKETHAMASRTIEQEIEGIDKYVDARVVREKYGKCCELKGDAEWEGVYDISTLVLWLKRIMG